MTYNHKLRKIVMDCQVKKIDQETTRKLIEELKKNKPPQHPERIIKCLSH